jgi:serine/threonine-protein kinase RsbW
LLSTANQAIVLESRIESADRAEAIAEELANRAGFEEQDRYRIAMAVREITVNAIAHGNRYALEKKVTVEFSLTADTLSVTVRDQGGGFDANHVPDPLSPENLLRQAGRGIFLARNFMDHFEVVTDSAGTRVRMSKHRPGRPSHPPVQ